MANTTGKKFGGRKKGTPNKRNATVTAYLNERGADPIKVLADLMVEAVSNNDNEKAGHYASLLAPYHSPKLAASKIEANVGVMTYEDKLALLDGE